MRQQEAVLLEQQFRRIITKLFKDFLVITDDIRQDHLAVIAELSSQFPPSLLNKWNYLDLPKYSRIRKKILDAGNDSIRESQIILSEMLKFKEK